MPLALLQADSSDVRRELARLGLSIAPSKIARDLLATYIQVFPIDARARCVDRHGGTRLGLYLTDCPSCPKSSTQTIIEENSDYSSFHPGYLASNLLTLK